MTPYQLQQLAVCANRLEGEARPVYDLVRSLRIPEEHAMAYLEATARLANFADQRAEEPIPGGWLRMAEQTAAIHQVDAGPPTPRTRGRPSRAGRRLRWQTDAS